jgi:hypothetical protein
LPTMADRRSKRSSAAVTVKKSNEPKLDLAARGAYKRPKLSESTGAPLVRQRSHLLVSRAPPVLPFWSFFFLAGS